MAHCFPTVSHRRCRTLPDLSKQPIQRIETEGISVLDISQATTATFTELYFRQTFLFFIERGSKWVSDPLQGDVLGNAGDLVIFRPGAMVTMENRTSMDQAYRAVGVGFDQELAEHVFPCTASRKDPPTIRVLRSDVHNPYEVLALFRDTLGDDDLPPAIRRHRVLEPLIWLKSQGIDIPIHGQDNPISQLRRIIESDLSHPWRAGEVASALAMSEATMRRWLAPHGQGFAKVLLHARLERGLTLLQTTRMRVTDIALYCGFKTPSHFSEAFRHRFGIQPKEIRSSGKLIDIR